MEKATALAVLLLLSSCQARMSSGPTHLDAAATSDVRFAADLSAGDASTLLCLEHSIDGGASVPFAAIQGIFDESCVSCHAGHVGARDGGAELNLQAGMAWGNLVGPGALAAESCGGPLVVPGNPDASYLYQKVTEDHPCSGERMPRGDVAFSLPDCIIALLRAWIATGAAGPTTADAAP